MEFIKNYIKSMRLYYAFVTLTCGWAGVAAYQSNNYVENIDKIIVLIIMFVGWGVNQIINDFMGLKEDRINAPERPMVTGKLRPVPALSVSIFVILIAIGWSVYKNPVSLIPLLGGVLMNIIYSWAKGFGILGNITFGLSISSCMIYGYTVLGGSILNFFEYKYTLIPWLLIVAFNMIMTYFTYFKDYEGDKEAGKNTLVVLMGTKRASFFGLFFSVIPLLLFLILNSEDMYFVISYVIAGLMFCLTGFLFYRKNSGDETYFNLKYNFAALSACQSAIVAYYYGIEGLILTVISIICVLTIFKLGYRNAKA